MRGVMILFDMLPLEHVCYVLGGDVNDMSVNTHYVHHALFNLFTHPH